MSAERCVKEGSLRARAQAHRGWVTGPGKPVPLTRHETCTTRHETCQDMRREWCQDMSRGIDET